MKIGVEHHPKTAAQVLAEATRQARELRRLLDKLSDLRMAAQDAGDPHEGIAPANLAEAVAVVEDCAGSAGLCDLGLGLPPAPEPLPIEFGAPNACPDCKSPRVVDINKLTFGCAECGGLYDKEKKCSA